MNEIAEMTNATQNEIAFIPPPPSSYTLFPYTTLFRSAQMLDPELVEQLLQPCGPLRLREQIGRATSELQSLRHLVCRLLLEKKKVTPDFRSQKRLLKSNWTIQKKLAKSNMKSKKKVMG